MKVAVLGGGAVGLSTALQLQQELRNAELDIIAADFDNTVSHVAAGLLLVSSTFWGPTEKITREWVKDSYEYYDAIRKSEEASRAGVCNVSGYKFSNFSSKIDTDLWIRDVVPIYRKATEEELGLIGGNWKYGTFCTTLLAQCRYYLPWAREKLQRNGAIFNQKKIDSLSELSREYDMIINCSGFGARDLCNDNRIVSIRGQVVKVHAPWIKTFFYADPDTYIIPAMDGLVTLGGSRSFNSENMEICPYESKSIRDKCFKCVPSLQSAKVIREEVGLRPHRENCVRVEADRLTDGNSKTILIHNYGHGGYGVSTAPGTGKYAVKLAIDMHRSSISKI